MEHSQEKLADRLKGRPFRVFKLLGWDERRADRVAEAGGITKMLRKMRTKLLSGPQ